MTYLLTEEDHKAVREALQNYSQKKKVDAALAQAKKMEPCCDTPALCELNEQCINKLIAQQPAPSTSQIELLNAIIARLEQSGALASAKIVYNVFVLKSHK